jgi:hypothetical protein
MIRALGLLLLCGGWAVLEDPSPKVFASANAPPRYQTLEQRAALARAQAEHGAHIAATEARWKREAEAEAAAEEAERRKRAALAAAREAVRPELQLLELTPAQAEELARHCPRTAYRIVNAQGVAGVAPPGAMSNEWDSYARRPLDLGFLTGSFENRIPAIQLLYQECSRESIYYGPAWVAPWPITAELQENE